PGADGLIAHLPMNEGQGVTTLDQTGNGHDAALVGGVAWSVGRFGQALQTDGLGASVTIPHSSALNLGANAGDFTVAFWTRIESGPNGEYRVLAKKGDDWDQRAFAMYLSPDSMDVSFAATTEASFNEGGFSNSQLAVGEWTHLTLVKRGLDLEFYLNGALDATDTLSAALLPNSGSIRLGDGPGDGAPNQAMYDDFRIYNQALSPEQIQQLPEAGEEGNDGGEDDGGGVGEELVLLTMDEGQGTTTADQSGRGHDAILSGGASWVTGHSGQGIQTNGVDGQIRIPHSSALNLGADNGDFTVVFRTRIEEGPTGDWRALAKKGENWEERAFGIYLSPDSNELTFSAATDSHFNEGGFALTEYVVGQWMHLAFVKRGASIELHVDGQLDSTEELNAPLKPNTGAIYLGDAPNDSGLTHATFDEFRILPRALTATELSALANEDASAALAAKSNGVLSASLSTASRTVSGPFSIEINFSDEVEGLTASDFQIANGAIGGLSSLSPSSYFATVTPAAEGIVTLQLPTGAVTGSDGSESAASNELSVVFGSSAPTPATPESHQVALRSGVSQRVTFAKTFLKPVVFTSVEAPENSPPLVVRLASLDASGFEVKVERLDGSEDAVSNLRLHAFAVEEGVYTIGEHGIKMEVGVVESPAAAGATAGWESSVPLTLVNEYNAPVVIGQVQSSNSERWSQFWWDRAADETIVVGHHVGRDPESDRESELVGYAVIESGPGVFQGSRFEAGDIDELISVSDGDIPLVTIIGNADDQGAFPHLIPSDEGLQAKARVDELGDQNEPVSGDGDSIGFWILQK
ncbi:MAG: LamG-like jellyroll fold domain-containing protein, partial [Verrucomicrobiota bacterium]